jgi:hypothetical protein
MHRFFREQPWYCERHRDAMISKGIRDVTTKTLRAGNEQSIWLFFN